MSEQQVREKIDLLFSYIAKEEHGDYLGEAISQLEHSLQSAMWAKRSGADEETILGALLHDIGHFITPSNEDISLPSQIAPNGQDVGRFSHDQLGENYLRDLGFSDKVCKLVGAHVMAKRYLTATDPAYYELLSPASKVSLKFQVSININELISFFCLHMCVNL